MSTKQYTTQQVAAGFGVSTMALSNWRKGQKGKTPLPTEEQPRGESGRSVRFDPAKVRAWAKEHGLTFNVSVALGIASNVKPGPKPVEKKPVKKSADKKATKPAVKAAPVAKKKSAQAAAAPAH